ncbi:MAG: protease modulator HflK [Planctomycetota bacterium]|nr:MAG: protease modulator HflK [Planctomycetota bacterium]
MAEKNRKNNQNLKPQSAANTHDDLDATGKSLSEALRTSFFILKIIMIVLVIVFLASGLRTVGPDEQALVLRFGKIRGIGEERLLGPGPHWVFPYPIDEIIKIPVAKKTNLPINSFWYYQEKKELLPEGPKPPTRIPQKLEPIKDGYCITRSEKQSQTTPGATGSDYNIVHCKWQLTYNIEHPERFFKNVYTEDVKPGQQFSDVIAKSITPLLEHLFDTAVVTAMVNYTIDEAISSQDRIPKHVKKLLQQKLDEIESGIAVVSVQLTDITWPRQVDSAFWASIRASQESQKAISEAKGYAENTLNEAAGPIATKLLAALDDETITEQEKEMLWSQLAGTAQEKIAQARAYRTKVLETAKANAEYLQKLLPEYRKHPELVIQEIYQDTIEYVLNNADEKMIIQPTEGTKGREIRVLLNRDPTIKPKSEKEK